MEKVTHPQLELFSQPKDYTRVKTRNLNKLFFSYIHSYEKVILMIIGFTVTSIVSFSLGVEKGKKLAISSITATPVMPTMIEKIEKQDKIKQPIIKDSSTSPPVQERGLHNYTIQVASYQSKASAQKEAQDLRKRGHPSLILSKGRYSVVCVGNFSDKEMARAMLSELKKRYQDCFIRKL